MTCFGDNPEYLNAIPLSCYLHICISGTPCPWSLQLHQFFLPNLCHHLLNVKEPGAGEHWWKDAGTEWQDLLYTSAQTLLTRVNEIWPSFFAALASQIAGLLSSIVVLLVVVAIGFVFQPLPQVGNDHDTIQKLGVLELGGVVISQHVFSLSFVFFLLVTDCTGSHHHSQPGGNVQTVQRHLCSLEDQQDWAGLSVGLSTNKYICWKQFF